MTFEDIRQRAKTKIRFHLSQQSELKKKYRTGDISKDYYLQRVNEHKLQITAIQSLFN